MPLIWDQIPLFEGTRRVLVGSTSQIFGLLSGAKKCVGSERSGSIIHWRYVRRIQEWASKLSYRGVRNFRRLLNPEPQRFVSSTWLPIYDSCVVGSQFSVAAHHAWLIKWVLPTTRVQHYSQSLPVLDFGCCKNHEEQYGHKNCI